MSKPRKVHTIPWTWHHDDGTDELCIAIQGTFGKRIVIAASQLREVADALQDRADGIDQPRPVSTSQDKQNVITKLRRENASLRNRLRTAGNAAKIRSIHMAQQNPTPTEQQLRERIEHLEHALNIANIKADQYRHVLVDHYGFDVDNPPEPSAMNRLTRDLGSTITATFPGEPVEGPDGPVGMTPTETITAPLVGIILTAAEVIRDGVDPTLRGLTIVDHDGQIIRRNPLEED